MTGVWGPEIKTAWDRIQDPEATGVKVKIAANIDVVTDLIVSFNPVSMDMYWKTYSWLSNPKRQDNALWPVVLDLWCRTYIDLLISVVQIASLTNQGDEKAWIAAAPENQKKNVQASYDKLWSTGKARLLQFEAANRLMLHKLAAIRPAAQNRGMCWHIGFTHEIGGIVHPVYAGDVIRQGSPARLTDNTLRISAAKGNALEGQPTYHIVGVGAGGDSVHGFFSPPYTNAKWERLPSLARPSDIWAVSGGHPDLPPSEVNNDEVCFYEAEGNRIAGYLRDQNGNVSGPFYDRSVAQPNPFQWVRAVHHPKALSADPDDLTESKQHPGVKFPDCLDTTLYIVYGLQKQGHFIHVDQRHQGGDGASPATDEGWVQGPWGSNIIAGIGIDQYYLWAFAPLGFACTTHASAISALKRYRATGQPQTPRWIHPRQPSEITSGPNVFPVTKGLADLSPCDDGTIVAAVFAPRGGGRPIYEVDSDDIDRSTYAAPYRIDINAGTMEVEKFTRVSGGARRVHKLPIFCWSEFEGLRETLENLGQNS
jgi:hypothetical protein